MNSLDTIVSLIETRAKEKYGSCHNMLMKNNINKSVIDNMKRIKPSIPNIITFCKIAECLDMSVDYLLLSKEAQSGIETNDTEKDKLTVDERSLINTYRKLNDDGKTIILDLSQDVRADYPLPIEGNQPKSKSQYYPLSEKNVEDAG